MAWPAYDVGAHFPDNESCRRLIRMRFTYPSGACATHWHDLTKADWRLVDVDTGDVVDLDTATEPSGRLEIFDKNKDKALVGKWKGVCDDSWDDTDAFVACRNMGFTQGSAVTGLNTSRLYLLDEVNCTGTEYNLFYCGHSGRGVHNCAYGEAAGAVCQ